MTIRLLKFLFGAATVIFLLAPLLAILPIAFTSSSFLAYPIPSLSSRWFAVLATEDAWRRSIVNSLLIGAGTTLLSTLLGILAALALRRRVVFAAALRTIFLLPMVVPAVVLGVGLQILFAGLGFPNTFAAVIVAHTVVAVPFVLVSITASLEGIDYRTERAAASLGASPAKVFWKVTLPLAMPGVLSGAVLAFATSLDEVVLTLFVAGPNQLTLARQMFSSIRENISPAIVAAAFLFIVATILLGGLLAVVHKRAARSAAA
ncbi:spermidine/putrescine ABC transporter permease protein [Rhizobium phaseoli]|uniref:ABC transporter permease n=1 Tax=Rhizobium phaseoli TaxID=396 RepID=UPI0007EA6AF3|nr:ABC transporter permease [Rhizobium phaseoli]ANL63906.1 spermidine/putrescine ABC transporter permease protein [Rhizobium phaseoli]ANL76723.1 spermidine/putrescine ABC transporter permease protein [Rhizobium phaseoli]ANM02356.1 spermidine/putrescine ABC transporter permease protein [Rhizobium phaseoli]